MIRNEETVLVKPEEVIIKTEEVIVKTEECDPFESLPSYSGEVEDYAFTCLNATEP